MVIAPTLFIICSEVLSSGCVCATVGAAVRPSGLERRHLVLRGVFMLIFIERGKNAGDGGGGGSVEQNPDDDLNKSIEDIHVEHLVGI